MQSLPAARYAWCCLLYTSISHDRYFLDQVTETTLYLANGALKTYSGGYSKFMEQKDAEELAYERAYEKQQLEIKELEDYINKYRAGIKSDVYKRQVAYPGGNPNACI